MPCPRLPQDFDMLVRVLVSAVLRWSTAWLLMQRSGFRFMQQCRACPRRHGSQDNNYAGDGYMTMPGTITEPGGNLFFSFKA